MLEGWSTRQDSPPSPGPGQDGHRLGHLAAWAQILGRGMGCVGGDSQGVWASGPPRSRDLAHPESLARS